MTGSSDQGPVRIVVLHPEDLMAPTIGGIATFLRDFVRLSPPDFEIDLVGATSDADCRPVGRWQTWDVSDRTARFLPLVHSAPADRLTRIPTSLRFTLALALARQRRLLRTYDRTVQFHRPEVPLALLRHHGPRVGIVHIDVRGGPQATRWRRIPAVYRRVEDITIPRMDRVFVANRAGVRLFRERYPAAGDRFGFLSSWYDDAIFSPVADEHRLDEQRAVTSSLDLSPETPDERTVLFVGRLEVEKDPSLLIDAYAALRASVDYPTRLLVAGEGSQRAATEERARSVGLAGHVRFLGARSRDEVARLMRTSDVLLLTSRSEGGGPRVVLEALGSGLPVVSTMVGEVADVVRNGSNGWLAEDRTPGMLAEGLRHVLGQAPGPQREAAVAAVRPFKARQVLGKLYEAHRVLARR